MLFSQIQEVLENNDPSFVEQLAQKAHATTMQYFGNAMSIYAPLYLANYCDNYCLYCGFQHNRQLERKKLDPSQMHREMEKISAMGMRNILLLTGESRKMTPVSYIKEAVQIAGQYFPSISLEVYPLEEEEYRELFLAGVDGVTVYQETYDRGRYKFLHPRGKKADYDYRYGTPERIARAGIRAISIGVLLGLSAIAADIFSLFTHLQWLEKHYPGVEYALSFPRIIPIAPSPLDYVPVSDLMLIKLICLSRILFPRVGINLSTRERGTFRDHALLLGVTKISAASKTNVGGYSTGTTKDPQFEVMDGRTVAEMVAVLKQKGLDPVFTDWRHFANEKIEKD
jgi:2-iminoacetate synthase